LLSSPRDLNAHRHAPTVNNIVMNNESSGAGALDSRTDVPVLSRRAVRVRGPLPHDSNAILALLPSGDASRFGLNGLVAEQVVRAFIEQVQRSPPVGAISHAQFTAPLSRRIHRDRRRHPGKPSETIEI
jgi:hypothetical protein